MEIKNYLLSVFLIAFLSLGLTSCSSEDEGANVSREELYETVISFKKTSDQKNVFSVLTNQEKYEVWQQKYDKFLSLNELTNDEINFINRIKKSFTPEMFDVNSNEHKIFNTIILDELFNEALIIFESKDREHGIKGKTAHFLFFELDAVLLGNDKEDDDDQISVCSCAVGSSYTCGRVSGGSLGGSAGTGGANVEFNVEFEFGSCHDKKCAKTSGGCGGLWTQDCNGSVCSY